MPVCTKEEEARLIELCNECLRKIPRAEARSFFLNKMQSGTVLGAFHPDATVKLYLMATDPGPAYDVAHDAIRFRA